MTETVERQSAQIYQFPKRGRFAAPAQRGESASVTAMASSRVARTALGGAWYHDEAIIEDRTRKN